MKGIGTYAMYENNNLQLARMTKNDEFYTLLDDIVSEMSHYRSHFAGKIIFCNCDDPTESNFWRYFHMNFTDLGLKQLVSTHFDMSGSSTYRLDYKGGCDIDISYGTRTPLRCNGDFRSEECIRIMEESDVVVTNPPFSLFREYMGLLIKLNKKFLIIGNENGITYKEIFPLVKRHEIWMGVNHVKAFMQPDGAVKKFGNVCWYTNLDIEKCHIRLMDDESIHCHYYGNEAFFPRYDNFDAINVDRLKNIPDDYYDIMGVPITYLQKYNPDEFEILGVTCRNYSPEYRTKVYSKEDYANASDLNGAACILVNGIPKKKYERLLIRRKF